MKKWGSTMAREYFASVMLGAMGTCAMAIGWSPVVVAATVEAGTQATVSRVDLTVLQQEVDALHTDVEPRPADDGRYVIKEN